jgi:hypothetical protein
MGLVEVYMNAWLTRGIAISMLGFAAIGCGGGDDDDDDKGGACSTPRVTGSPFNTGTASAHGAGMLLAGPPDGFELELSVDDGTGADPFFPDGISRTPTVCGSAFTYEVTKLAAGTYKMTYDIYDPNDYTTAKFTATSKNDFTVAEGASVEFSPTF